MLRTQNTENRYRRCQRQEHHHHLASRLCGHTVEVTENALESWAGHRARTRLRRRLPHRRTPRNLRQLRRHRARLRGACLAASNIEGDSGSKGRVLGPSPCPSRRNQTTAPAPAGIQVVKQVRRRTHLDPDGVPDVESPGDADLPLVLSA
ncbi:hypothetical protein B1A87_007595 [Arthrobacter sp. KBS0703]|uniref:transcriptional repressor n=1 Tax=Arthrobacter sp. KBS0703 TaxID=1955698 RepID=UPI0009D22435|nr:hypothetical protein B1A87_007595 [Arthrobacter sp. KBS0703]